LHKQKSLQVINFVDMSERTLLQESEELLTISEKEKNLILHNDDHNTFDFVIETLVEVCDHEYPQAEQCAMITHFKGKCDVKKETFDVLKPMKLELQNRGLTVSIE